MSKGIRGSSTCILALLYHSTLCLANLGDCALLLIRNGEVILRTSEMQHAFNHPLQVRHSLTQLEQRADGRWERTREMSL